MLLRHIARPMLASWFVFDGAHAVLHPGEHAASARRGADLISERTRIDQTLSEAQVTTLVRAHGAATVVAGLCLAFGKAPRAAAFTLAALTVPLAVVNEPFTPGGDRAARSRRFVGDISAVGATLLAGADLAGKPGVQWRVARVRRDLATAKKVKNAASGGLINGMHGHDRGRTARHAASST